MALSLEVNKYEFIASICRDSFEESFIDFGNRFDKMKGMKSQIKVRYKTLAFLGFPKYRVGDDGSVWTHRCYDEKGFGRRWRWVRRGSFSGTRPQVVLRSNGKCKGFLIYQLVLLAFVGPCPKGMQCRHYPDRDPFNNRLDNISWATPKVNQLDRIEHGTHVAGEQNRLASLTNQQAKHIRLLHKSGRFVLRELAEMYDTSIGVIHLVVKFKTYRY